MTRRVGAAALAVAAATLITAAPRGQAPQGVETFDAAWAIVRDRHYDPATNGVDWTAVREELRPRAAAARTTNELRGVLRDMLGRLGQSHFAIIPSTTDSAHGSAAQGSGAPGLELRLVGRDLLVVEVDRTGPAFAAGVRPGWRLTAVGSTPAADLLRPVFENANERLWPVEAWRIAESRLRGQIGTKTDVTFEDAANRPVTLAIERRPEPGEPVTLGHLPTMHVRVESGRRQTRGGRTAGVIRFNVWMAAVDAPFQKAVDELRGADGMIVDLRGNPGGLAAMIMGIAGHFVPDRKVLGVMKTRQIPEMRFAVNPRLVSAAGQPVDAFAGPVALLVDTMSGSASECFAGGMQSIGRVRVFGQTTMGQALPAQVHRLPNGDAMIYAFGDFVTADGTRLEGRGVIPDETVPLRREDLLAGHDRTLEAALSWIDRARTGGTPQNP